MFSVLYHVLLQSLKISKDITLSDKKIKIEKPSRFSATLFFSPDFTSYHLKNDKHNMQPEDATEIEKNEKHEFSSTVGILIDYKLNKHWGLQTGLTYSNTNITADPKTIYAQPDNTGNVKYRINTSSGYGYVLPSFSSNTVIGDSLYAFISTHTLQYISIPAAVKYNVAKGRFGFNVFAGLSANLLINGKIETTVDDGTNNETEFIKKLQGLKKVYLAGATGLGVEYRLNKKMAITFAPTFRFALTSINRDVPVKSYPNSFGLALGLKISL